MSALDILSVGNLAVVAGLVPVVVGLIQVCKIAGLPSRFAPLASVVAGVSLSLVFGAGLSLSVVVLYGLLAGLSAAGLYSGIKTAAGV